MAGAVISGLVRCGDFPEPVAQLPAGNVWQSADVEAWQERHRDRRSGRPPQGSTD